jgi:putative aminopeptidase FrvX
MGSSSSEAGDEDRISDGVGSDANAVVVDLADVSRATLAHKCKRAHGEFPWAHTHGWMEGDPLAQKGKH